MGIDQITSPNVLGQPEVISGVSPERRTVSILYADIVSSTSIIAKLDPEDIPDFLDPPIKKMVRAIRKFGGNVLRVQGDGIKAVFGATKSQEHHALRAAYAGQEILHLMQKEPSKPHIPVPDIRIGIHSGVVVVRWQENDFGGGLDTIGTASHIAAKVENAGRPNYVTVSGVTADLIQDYARLEPVKYDISELLAEAGHPCEILSLDDDFNIQAQSRGRAHLPLLGRKDELENIQHYLSGDGLKPPRPLWVFGKAGIGKSRLIAELAILSVQKNYRVETLRTLVVFKDSPFYLIRKLLKRLLRLPAENSTYAEIHSLLQDIDLSPHQLTGLSHLLSSENSDWIHWDIPTDDKIKAIQNGVAELVKNISTHDHLRLIIEDLHDADSESLRCLNFLSEQCSHKNLSLLVTSRSAPEDNSIWGHFKQVELLPLKGDIARSLVLEYCEAANLKPDEATVEVVLERCEGMPFALLEFTKMAAKLEPDRLETPLPLALEPLLRLRFDDLTRQEKKLIDHACVLGSEFSRDDLEMVLGLGQERFSQILDRVVAKKLLFYTDDAHLSFEHRLYHDVCYNSLLRKKRRHIHLKIYQKFEDSYNVEPQLLAYHASEANNLDQALVHLWEACDLAIAQSAIRTVRSLYFRVVDICDQIGAEADYQKVKFALKTFDAFHQLTIQKDHLHIYEAALTATNFELSPAEKALVICNIAVIKWISEGDPDAIIEARQAFQMASALNYFPMICYSEFVLANIEFALGHVQAAVTRLQAMADKFGNESRATRFGHTIILPSVMYRAFASWYCVDLGDFDQATKLWEAANHIATREDHGYSKAICNMALGYRLYRMGNSEVAAPMLAKNYQTCLDNSYLGIAPMLAGWACMAYLECGHIDIAADIINKEIASNRTGRVKNSSRYYVLAAKAALVSAQGDKPAAREAYEAALQLVRSTKDPVHQAYAHADFGKWYDQDGVSDMASKHFSAARKIARACGMQGIAEHGFSGIEP